MRYKEELEAIARREAYLRRKYLMPVLTCIILVTVLIAGTAVKSVSARAAATDTADVRLSNVTKKEIEDAKKKRDETKKKAQSAASKVSALKNQKKQLNYELMALNDANDEQRAQYEEIAASLQAALDARVQALEDYITAEENLVKRTEEFQNRVSVMFQFQNKSMFEVLLESDSLAGFFTNMEIMNLIADADAQAVDSMKIAVDDAKLQKELALKEAEDLQDIADEKQKQLDDLLAEEENRRTQLSAELEHKKETVTAEIGRAREAYERIRREKTAAYDRYLVQAREQCSLIRTEVESLEEKKQKEILELNEYDQQKHDISGKE